MADNVETLYSLAKTYRSWADSQELENPDRAARHRATSESLDAAAKELEEARARLLPIPASYGDLSDLPQEVLAQLNLTKIDDLEQQLRDIVASADGALDLDSAIIELYRRHKAVHPRRFVMNKLYRMAQKGLIEPVERKKGVYRLPTDRSSSGFGSFGGEFSDDLDEDVPF